MITNIESLLFIDDDFICGSFICYGFYIDLATDTA